MTADLVGARLLLHLPAIAAIAAHACAPYRSQLTVGPTFTAIVHHIMKTDTCTMLAMLNEAAPCIQQKSWTAAQTRPA